MFCLRAYLVHGVSELVEVGLHLAVVEQGRFVWGRGGEVAQHGADNRLSVSCLQQTSWLQSKHGSVPILPLPGMQVDVELTEESVGGRIEHGEQSGLGVPGGGVLDFNELEIQDLLVDF